MATPKEKAKELINKYIAIYIDNPKFRNEYIELAKESSLLCVDEILKYQPYDIYTIEQSYNVNSYWQETKQEIEKL